MDVGRSRCDCLAHQSLDDEGDQFRLDFFAGACEGGEEIGDRHALVVRADEQDRGRVDATDDLRRRVLAHDHQLARAGHVVADSDQDADGRAFVVAEHAAAPKPRRVGIPP